MIPCIEPSVLQLYALTKSEIEDRM
jgi:hypothetical protein